MRLSPLTGFVFLVLGNVCASEVQLYDFPAEAPKAGDFRVTVNGQEAFVYDTKVAAIATFGIDGQCHLRVERKEPFKKVVVRPLHAGIEPKVAGQTIEFTISTPARLSVEWDDDIRRPLYVFANQPENRPTGESSEKVKYFGPGKVHRAGQIDLASGETLYLAGGAIVEGYVRAADAENVRIAGPGILDASYRREEKITSVLLRRCRNVEIVDLLIADSFGWTVHLSQCDGVEIAGMKQVGWRANSDGIDIEASRNVHVADTFLRNDDDCVAVKSKPQGDGKGVVTEDILIENTVFWNALPGNAMEVGFELVADAIRNVTFRNCDIIRVERGAAFSIHNGDNAQVENIKFEDIRVEDVRGDFADFYIGISIYSADCPDPYRRSDPRRKPVPPELQDPPSGDNRGQWLLPKDKAEYAGKRGTIRNVVFRRIQFLSPPGGKLPSSLFIGYDDEHPVENVLFENISLDGQRLTRWPEGAVYTRHAKNVRFEE